MGLHIGRREAMAFRANRWGYTSPVAFRSTFDWVWAAACQRLGRCRWRPWWPLSSPARVSHAQREYV